MLARPCSGTGLQAFQILPPSPSSAPQCAPADLDFGGECLADDRLLVGLAILENLQHLNVAQQATLPVDTAGAAECPVQPMQGFESNMPNASSACHAGSHLHAGPAGSPVRVERMVVFGCYTGLNNSATLHSCCALPKEW